MGAEGAKGAAGAVGGEGAKGVDGEAGAERAARALRLLVERGQTLAVAESLTGGLVAAALTAVPGASQAFVGSVTAYATRLKRDVLGVPGPLLAAHGAVDPRVAEAMAAGVRERLAADWGLATTGVAGPEPQDGQPVGTVHVAVSGPRGRLHTALALGGDRAGIRSASVDAALGLLVEALTRYGHPDRGAVPGRRTAGNTEQGEGP